jgi:hypothetical protein
LYFILYNASFDCHEGASRGLEKRSDRNTPEGNLIGNLKASTKAGLDVTFFLRT